MSELKPCPFCGGNAKLTVWTPTAASISCIMCGAHFNTYTEAEAVEAWNTRHVETDALREACRELVEYAGTCPFDAKDTDTANWSERCDRECCECSTDVDMAACWMRYFMEVES